MFWLLSFATLSRDFGTLETNSWCVLSMLVLQTALRVVS